MASTAKNYELTFNGDDALIAKQLQTIITDSESLASKELIKLSAALERERAAERMHNNKVSARSAIYTRAQQRLAAKEAEYDRARARTRAARQKLMDRSSKSSQARDRAERCERAIAQIKRRLELNGEIYTEDGFEKRALMIRFIEGLIDTRVPIKFSTISADEQKLTWRTNDIFIKDGFGSVLPHNFGKFDCSVTYNGDPVRGNRVTVYCKSVNPDEGNRRNYPHPHLNEHGAACLGNIQPTLIQDMGVKDIAKVIETLTDFLQHYNRENPYVHLSAWCPNRWDNAVCESGNHIMADCECPRCNECGTIQEQEDLSGCGHCHSCCMVHHVHPINPPASYRGINGTPCISRNEYAARFAQQQTNPGGTND